MIKNSIRPGKRLGLVVAGVAVTLVAVVVGAVALLRPGNSAAPASGPAAVQTLPADSARRSTPTPGPTTTPTSNRPEPTPESPPQQGFEGTYQWVSVVTFSSVPGVKVGKRESATWRVRTTCTGETCTTKVKSSVDKTPFDLPTGQGGWRVDKTFLVQCINQETGKPLGGKVPMRHVRSLDPGPAGAGGIPVVRGKERYLQLKKCKRQVVPMYDVRYSVTLSRTR